MIPLAVGCGDKPDCDEGTVEQDGECIAQDEDDDGVTVEDGDCDDNEPAAYPGADEVCDGIDNDCDGDTDEDDALDATL